MILFNGIQLNIFQKEFRFQVLLVDSAGMENIQAPNT